MSKLVIAVRGWRGLISFSVGVPLFLACAPGAIVVSMLALQADEIATAILAGQLSRENSLFLATSLCGAALGAAACFYLVSIKRQLLRLLAAAGCGLLGAVVAAGLAFWVGIELGGRLLMLSTQIALALMLLWAGRNAWGVVTAFWERSAAAVQRLALAAAGSLFASALGGAVATGRGLEPSLLARPQWFYVLAVPAVAGFGLSVPQPNVPTKLFSVLTLIVVLLTTSYSLGTVLFGLPEISCDMHIRNPHYEVLGFSWEPWRWSQRETWRWIFAPGTLTELSVLHIVDPVPNLVSPPGGYCQD